MSAPKTGKVITYYAYEGGPRVAAEAVSLARLLARSGLRVVLVDFDLNAPRLRHLLQVSTPPDAPGVLDFLAAWGDALARDDEMAPPVPIPLSVAVRLSVLTAGARDGYVDRLHAFSWSRFYADAAGAAAIETLRSALTRAADAVIVLSAPGLGPTAGVVTMQMPDGVVLVAEPSEESLSSARHIAQSLATAPPGERAGRPKPAVWLSVDGCTEARGCFNTGVRQGLWRDERIPEAAMPFWLHE